MGNDWTKTFDVDELPVVTVLHDARFNCTHATVPSTRVRYEHTTTTVAAHVTCWRCKSEQRRTRANTRKPPELVQQAGCCTLCATPLTRGRTRWCSDLCSLIAFAMGNQTALLGHLAAVAGRACWQCGTSTDALDVDHVRPLWSLDAAERTQPRWWLPFNLQLLCAPCHKTKTAREAAARAKVNAGATYTAAMASTSTTDQRTLL